MSTGHDEGHRKIAPGRSGYWQAWLPRDPVRAVIVIVHGVHEHSARYAHVGTRLAAAGFAVYAADHRGHGRSDGRRGNIERMALIVADLASFVRFALERHPGLPVFMVGHSLGGLIALHYATEPGTLLDGLVVSGPAVQAIVGSALQRRLAGVLSTLVPNVGVVTLDADQKISRDPEVVRAYREDPLVYRGKVKARTGAESLAMMEALPARLPRLSMPLLLLHGTDDRICAPAGSAMVHDAVSSPDNTLRQYQGLYHEVFNEPEREQILTDLVSWLNHHLPATHPAG
ncbi:MAG: lysophospholipase [Pseudonocardiales bacterium]|nr:lysophospholipase [Pseudonocardiales bacterium]MBV9029625.1 lysophospholipase [Pseudonocardiales bacterium]